MDNELNRLYQQIVALERVVQALQAELGRVKAAVNEDHRDLHRVWVKAMGAGTPRREAL